MKKTTYFYLAKRFIEKFKDQLIEAVLTCQTVNKSIGALGIKEKCFHVLCKQRKLEMVNIYAKLCNCMPHYIGNIKIIK